MNELKKCPLCGKQPKICWLDENRDDLVACHNDDCSLFSILIPIDEWNTRPDTDLLRRIKEAVEEIKAECKSLFSHDMQVVAMDLYILSKHIPELEAQDDTD